MKTKRFNRKIPENVSNIHRRFFKYWSSLYPSNQLFCEYPCYKLCEKYCKKQGYSHLECKKTMTYQRVNRLHIDIYDSTLKLAFEIQGEQHTKFIEFFHGDMSGLDRQKSNDRWKKYLCDLLDISIIYINDKTNFDDILRGKYGK